MLRKIIDNARLIKQWFRLGGFTLVELMAVLIIISVLATIALPKYYATVESTRAAEAYATLGMIVEAQKRYALDNDVYTTSLDNLDINTTNPGKYFQYYLCPQAFVCVNPLPYNANNNEVMAVAQKIPSLAYLLAINETGNFICLAGSCP